MELSALAEPVHHVLDLMFGALLESAPPAAMVAVAALLLALALGAGWCALRSLLVIHAVAATRQAQGQIAGERARIKVRGAARAVLSRPDAGAVVWMERARHGGDGSRSWTQSCGDLLVDAGTALYAVRTEAATVVATESSHEQAFLDPRRFTTTRFIRSGDPLWAIGRPEPLSGAGERPLIRLRRSGGVLLVSGRAEREVIVRYGLWLTVELLLALTCCGLLAWAVGRHLVTYPPCAGDEWRAFAARLSAAPFTPEPGLTHAGWSDSSAAPEGCVR